MLEEKEQNFSDVVSKIESISNNLHKDALVKHAWANKPSIEKSIRFLAPPEGKKALSVIIVSAGPSIHRQNSINQILESNYEGSIVAVDGSLISCLNAGLVPDYVLTLDAHETRIVRWFGDPNFEKNSKNDDYFERQDLDVNFRSNQIEKNQDNIDLIDKFGTKIKAVVCSSAPENVASRIKEANFDAYWWNPLVDNPQDKGSLTRVLYEINNLPCMNTGGNVGTAAWVFATTILNIPNVALLGMDFGYYADLPYSKTQKYYELIEHLGSADGLDSHFPSYTYPSTGEKFYTDATYYWYRKNFLELLRLSDKKTYNCTGGGVLFNDDLDCVQLLEFLKKV